MSYYIRKPTRQQSFSYLTKLTKPFDLIAFSTHHYYHIIWIGDTNIDTQGPEISPVKFRNSNKKYRYSPLRLYWNGDYTDGRKTGFEVCLSLRLSKHTWLIFIKNSIDVLRLETLQFLPNNVKFERVSNKPKSTSIQTTKMIILCRFMW